MDAIRAVLIIIQLAEFFARKVEQRLVPGPGQIRRDFAAMPKVVSFIKANRGQLLIDLREQLGVNIISPKSYEDNPRFSVIGRPVSLSPLYSMPFSI